jgi:hypothetical protein
MTLLCLMLGAGGVLAQSASPPPRSVAKPPAQSPPTDNIAECMRLWDAATHMTKREWLRTCHRIQTRLDTLKLDSLETTPKATRKNSRK